MKKILSVLICVVMLGAMLCTPAFAANELVKSYDEAKDGELLYDVVFNAADGVYVPRTIREAAGAEIVVSDDGKTISVTHESANKGGFWYGGEIKGLTIAPDKSYTLTGKARVTGTNGGIYFNDCEDYLQLFGFYGGQKNNDMTLDKGGKKTTGAKCDGSAYQKYEWQTIQAAAEDQYINFMIIVEGYNYSVYFNGELFDTHTGTAEEFAVGNDKIGVAFYVYNKNASVTATDVKLYKGNKLTATETPATEAPTTEAPVTEAPVTDAPTTDAPVTEPDSPVTGDNTAVIVMIVAVVAMLGTAVTVKVVKEK